MGREAVARVFISGIIQGSSQDHGIEGQNYRQLIAQALRARHPDVEIVDPWELYPDAVSYPREKAKQTLLEEIELARTCDVMIVYVPQASMGSALEMWAAYEAGARIIAISEMTRNWVVQSLSAHILPTLDDFLAFIEEGGLSEHLDGRMATG